MAVEPSVPGLRKCNKCGQWFRSADKDRIRRCTACHKKEESYNPRAVRIADVHGAIRQHTGEK